MEDRKAAKVLEERIREEFKVSQQVEHLRAATNASSQATGAHLLISTKCFMGTEILHV